MEYVFLDEEEDEEAEWKAQQKYEKEMKRLQKLREKEQVRYRHDSNVLRVFRTERIIS